uniref:(northern house mosquito) hypothetical protein n=1 Tax=Culex pipiens TaxID=7175 RepID=A0A8D8F3U7_CULPI
MPPPLKRRVSTMSLIGWGNMCLAPSLRLSPSEPLTSSSRSDVTPASNGGYRNKVRCWPHLAECLRRWKVVEQQPFQHLSGLCASRAGGVTACLWRRTGDESVRLRRRTGGGTVRLWR